MRTTLDLDPAALTAALEASPGLTKSAVVNEALRGYVRRRVARGLPQFEGKDSGEGGLEQPRRDG